VYLLDSDTIIYNLKGHAAVVKHLEDHLLDPIKISVITLMELYYGAYKSQKIEANLAKVVNGKVVRRADGKIMKPAGWQDPQPLLDREISRQLSDGSFSI
jgi:hypothetical protein